MCAWSDKLIPIVLQCGRWRSSWAWIVHWGYFGNCWVLLEVRHRCRIKGSLIWKVCIVHGYNVVNCIVQGHDVGNCCVNGNDVNWSIWSTRRISFKAHCRLIICDWRSLCKILTLNRIRRRNHFFCLTLRGILCSIGWVISNYLRRILCYHFGLLSYVCNWNHIHGRRCILEW